MHISVCLLVVPAFLLGASNGFNVQPHSLVSRDADFIFSVEDLVKEAAVGAKANFGPALAKRNLHRGKRSAGISSMDAIVDFLLAGAAPQIISNGKASIPVPDFSFNLDLQLGDIFKVSGWVSTAGGSLQDMKSLFRQGPVVVRQEPKGVLVLHVAVGFHKVSLDYSSYNASIDGLNFQGQLQMVISPAVLDAQVQLVAPCSIQLRDLQMSQMGKLQLKITGLPKIFGSIPLIAEHLFDRLEVRNEISRIVAGHVSQIIIQQLKNISCK